MERLWAPLLGRHGIPLRLAWGIHFTKWLQVLSFGAVAIVASSNAHPQLATAAKLSSWLTLARADTQLGVLIFYYAWVGALLWLLSLSGLWLLAAAFSGAFSPRCVQQLHECVAATSTLPAPNLSVAPLRPQSAAMGSSHVAGLLTPTYVALLVF